MRNGSDSRRCINYAGALVAVVVIDLLLARTRMVSRKAFWVSYAIVLGFQLILVFLIFSAVYGLALQAATVGQVLATLGLLVVTGTFFYFMVKAMARIQMPTRE